jgi:hypothetical protein
LTKHLLQNLSPGLMELPHALHTTLAGRPGVGAGGPPIAAFWKTGGLAVPATEGAGVAVIVSGTFTRHLLQNLSPDLIGLPQALHTKPCGGVVGCAATEYLNPHSEQNKLPGFLAAPQLLQKLPCTIRRLLLALFDKFY